MVEIELRDGMIGYSEKSLQNLVFADTTDRGVCVQQEASRRSLPTETISFRTYTYLHGTLVQT